MLDVARGAVLVGAVLAAALQAGLYYAFACAVLPGLGRPEQVADLAALRGSFAPAWERWNTVRAVSSTLGGASLAWALVEHGRAAAG